MTRSALLPILVALVAGGAIGYVIGSGSATEAPTVAEPAPREDTPRAGGSNAEPPPPVPPGLVDAIGTIPLPAARAGSGTIRGTVKTSDGRPVEGVLVRAWLHLGGAPTWNEVGAPPADPTMAESVRDLVRRRHYSRATRREARTGADGTFAITGLPDEGHSVQAWKKGWTIHRSGAGGQVQPGATVNFSARAVSYFEAVVLLPDGTEAETAQLSCVSSTGTRTTAHWKSGARRMNLSPGTWTITAQAEKGAYASEPLEVKLTEGGSPPSVTFRVAGRPGVRGEIEVAEGEEPGGLEVVLLQAYNDETPDLAALRAGGRREWIHDMMDRGYHYVFVDVAPGDYWVAALAGRRRIADLQRVVVGDMMVVQNLRFEAPDRSEYVILWVEGPDGKDLADVSLSTGYRASNMSSSGGGSTKRLEDGSWRVAHHTLDEGDLREDGRYYITVTSKEFGIKEVEYERSDAGVLRVRFDAPGHLLVTVTGFAGGGHENRTRISVSMLGEEDAHSTSQSVPRLSAEGEVRVGPLAPGTYRVDLQIQTDEHQAMPVAEVEVSVGPGENRAVVAMPRLYDLTVLLDEGEKSDFQLQSGDGRRWFNPRSPTDGRVVFRHLPAGRYLVRKFGGMSGQMEVDVPGQTTVRFEAQEVNALRVSINDENGSFYKAGLREGDLVMGINGTEFKGEVQMMTLFQTAMAEEKAVFTVLRGNRVVDVEFPIKEMMESRGDSGGNLNPTHR